MSHKPRHATTAVATLRPEMPSLRRMPPPSRLPEFDLDGAQTLSSPAAKARSAGVLAGVWASLAGWTRR